MKVGLVGYAGSGKTTIFQWLTPAKPDPAKVQQGQIGTTIVPDDRLRLMALKFNPKKDKNGKYAEIVFLDTPGLQVGEQKDNARRLAILREANGLVVVLDGFSGADPMKQLSNFRDELIFADLEIVMNRIEKVSAQLKKNRPLKEKEQDEIELGVMKRIQEALETNQSIGSLGLKREEEKVVRSFQLFTLKPQMVFLNQSDNDAGKAPPENLRASCPHLINAAAKLEWELSQLDAENRELFMSEYGLKELSGPKIIREIFYGMDRIVFFTVGEDECRSWPLNKNSTAVEGAGAIHTDLAKGFIRAEVVSYADFLATGYSEKDCKAKGTFRLEGKEYIVQDGDIMHIRANA